MDLSGVRRDVVVPVRVDRQGRGGPTPDEVRGRRWRRTSRGFYVPAGTDSSDPEQRIVEAAIALQDDWGGVTGWAGLGWDGAAWFDGFPWGGGPPRPVTLAIGGNRTIRPQPGFDLSEERLSPPDHVVVDGVRLTTHVRSVCFEMRHARGLRDAVTTLAMACFNDHVSIDEVRTYAATLAGWDGIPLCRKAIVLADENLWSPTEVDMLLTWLEAGLPRPRCNAPVFDLSGTLLGTPDLIDPNSGVVGEYDGALHLLGQQRSKDVTRAELFRDHGLEPVVMMAADRSDRGGFVSRLHAAYRRAAHIPPSRRRWTLEQPDWWRDTSTVAARRALDEHWRSRLLAHRQRAA